MKRKLIVWGGEIHLKGKQVRAIVATRTKKAAYTVLGLNSSYFTNYWCDTENEIELKVALPKEGVVFVASSVMGKDFKERNTL